MFNPRNSFISTSSATTYPSTLSPPKTSLTPLTPPISPRHPGRLHRSSKRNLRSSASSASLRAIVEDPKASAGQAEKTVIRKHSSLALPVQAAVVPTQTTGPPSVNAPAASQSRPPYQAARPDKGESVAAWARNVNNERQPTSRPASSASTARPTLSAKASRERVASTKVAKSTLAPATASPPNGLGLVTGAPAAGPKLVKRQESASQAVAQPRRPEPIDVNPKKQDSFAEEWERELIQSAKDLHIQVPMDKGKSREVDKDVEWERSGRWQADVDPAREAEDRQRRDAGRAIAFPPSQPKAPIRAAANGVTSIHIGVRPRLHPSRANSSMSLNQPDTSLAQPLGSPLGDSQAANLPSGSSPRGAGRSADLMAKARAEYEAWLSKKEEREAGVGQPHDYGTREWAAKGRIPARPSSLSRMASEGSTMPNRAPALQPPPVLVRAVSHETIPEEPVLATPDNSIMPPPAMYTDPAYLAEPQMNHHNGDVSNRSSMNDMRAAYMHHHPPAPAVMPDGQTGEMYPVMPQYPYHYPYDPSFGYAIDPAMYQQYWSNPSWYAPHANWYGAQQQGEQLPGRETKVHFEDDSVSADVNNAKGMEQQMDQPHPDASLCPAVPSLALYPLLPLFIKHPHDMVTMYGAQGGPQASMAQMGAYQQPGTPYGGVGFGLGGYAAGGQGEDMGGGGGMSMMGTPIGQMGGMWMNMMGGGPMGPGAGMGMGGMGSMSRGLAFGLPQQANGLMGGMGMGHNGNPMMGYGQGGQWGGMGGMPMMGMGPMGGMGMNPYMMAHGQGQGQFGAGPGPSPVQSPGGATQPGSAYTDPQGNELKPFDSTQMKRGRMGHYGYLDGRELAGPPVGYLPAGAQNLPGPPPQAGSMISPAQGQGQASPGIVPGSYFPQASVAGSSVPRSQASGSMWGDAGNMPRARYDGTSHSRYMQADTDTPYPRNKAGGMSASWTRYNGDEAMELDSRYSVGHRMREGRV